MANKKEILEILNLGIQAPSGDNWQPWKFKVQNNSIQIFNASRDTTIYNKLKWGSYIAFGALIENILIGSRDMGFNPVLTVSKNLGHDDYVGEISLEPNKQLAGSEPLRSCIIPRATNRKQYQTTPLSKTEAEEIQKSITKFDPVKVQIIDDRKTIGTIADSASVNEKLLFKNDFMHKSFMETINWTKEEDEKNSTGLYIETLELPPPAKFVFRLIRKDFWFNLSKKIGLYNLVRQANIQNYTKSGNILIFSIPNFTHDNLLMIGRAMQHTWLTLTFMGYSCQPMSALLFLYYVSYEGKAPELSNEETEEVKKAFQKIKEINTSQHPVFILRTGKAENPTAKASRLEPVIEWIQ